MSTSRHPGRTKVWFGLACFTIHHPSSETSAKADRSAVNMAKAAPPSTTQWVRFCVADNGIGIHPKYHDKIWHMFQRLSKNYEGIGIGLARVRKVVERMGGKVGLESAPGQGSRFWIELQKAHDTHNAEADK